jgi:hypothetical protein
VLACLTGRPDLGVAIVAHTGLEDLVSPATIWRALPLTGRPMTVRWWYEPAGTLPDGDADRREWLRLHWAIVDSWIDARKAARSGQLSAIDPGSERPESLPAPAPGDSSIAPGSEHSPR